MFSARGTEGNADGSNLVVFLYTMSNHVEYIYIFFQQFKALGSIARQHV